MSLSVTCRRCGESVEWVSEPKYVPLDGICRDCLGVLAEGLNRAVQPVIASLRETFERIMPVVSRLYYRMEAAGAFKELEDRDAAPRRLR